MQMPEISIEGVGAAKVCLVAFEESLGRSISLSRLDMKARVESLVAKAMLHVVGDAQLPVLGHSRAE